MSVIKSVSAVVLVIALAGVSFVSGKKVGVKSVVIPHVYVADPATGNAVPLNVPDGAQIFVASPVGVEPGVLAGHSKDGKKILILPPSLIGGDDAGPAPQNQAHRQLEMSNGERLDRASARF